jgi:hypothetical protein
MENQESQFSHFHPEVEIPHASSEPQTHCPSFLHKHNLENFFSLSVSLLKLLNAYLAMPEMTP